MSTYCKCTFYKIHNCKLNALKGSGVINQVIFNDLLKTPYMTLNSKSNDFCSHGIEYILKSCIDNVADLKVDMSKLSVNIKIHYIKKKLDSFNDSELNELMKHINNVKNKDLLNRIYDKCKDKFDEKFMKAFYKNTLHNTALFNLLVNKKIEFPKNSCKIMLTIKNINTVSPIDYDTIKTIVDNFDISVVDDPLGKIVLLGKTNITETSYLQKIVNMGYKFNNKIITNMLFDTKEMYDFVIHNMDFIDVETIKFFATIKDSRTFELYKSTNLKVTEDFFDIDCQEILDDVYDKLGFMSDVCVSKYIENSNYSVLSFIILKGQTFSHHNVEQMFESSLFPHDKEFTKLYDYEYLYNVCCKYGYYPFVDIKPKGDQKFAMSLTNMSNEDMFVAIKKENIDLDESMFEKAMEYWNVTQKRIDTFTSVGIRPTKTVLINLLQQNRGRKYACKLIKDYF
jgi:hypothetical protein